MELTELNINKHRHLKLQPMPSFRHVEGTNLVALGAEEIPRAALAYPVVFARTENGFHPFALLGLSETENLYLEDNKWLANYIPAAVRSYPFRFAGERVLIDESAPHFEGEKGAELFDESGSPSTALNEQLTFLGACRTAELETSAWVERLVKLDLLVERHAEVVSPQGRRYRLQGFYMVDAARIPLLADKDLTVLARDGSLSLIYAHLLSLEHLISLAARRDRLAPDPEESRDETPASAEVAEAESSLEADDKISQANASALDSVDEASDGLEGDDESGAASASSAGSKGRKAKH